MKLPVPAVSGSMIHGQRVDIVLPVYNEERDLAKSVLKLRRFLHSRLASYRWHIVIVDNASSDTTSEIGQILADQFPDLTYRRLEERGRGRALRHAWQASSAEIVCYMDVDLSTDLESLGPLIASVTEEGYDLATGSRLIAGARVKRSFKREVLSRCYNLLLRGLLRVGFNDSQCGFKAMRRQVVEPLLTQVLDQAWFFDSELLIKAQWMGLRIKEIPVCWVEDPESRVKLWETSWNYIRSIARLRKERRPQATHLGIVGFICSSPPVSDFIRNVLAGGLRPIKQRIRQALVRAPQDRVLDVGCGSGIFSQLVKGRYIGIDTDCRFIEYARRRYGVPNRVQFECHPAAHVPYADQLFDQGLLINVMHHLPDDALHQALGELGRMTRHQVIIVDMVPLKYNLLGMLCYRLDQGQHIRAFAEQAAHVARFVDIRESGCFRSGINLHSWFVGTPKRNQRVTEMAEEAHATA